MVSPGTVQLQAPSGGACATYPLTENPSVKYGVENEITTLCGQLQIPPFKNTTLKEH